MLKKAITILIRYFTYYSGAEMFVFINSHKDECQVSSVSDVIKSRGFTPIIFERYRKDHFITYEVSNDKLHATVHIEGKTYSLNSETFPTVWSRIKPIVATEIPGEESELREKFCVHEWRHALNSLDVFLTDSKWINNSINNSQISRKAYQLKLATECDLLIPQTVISNNNIDILPLFKSGKVIYKTLSSFYTKFDSIYTNEINQNIIENSAESVAMAPSIYQSLIKKSYELRVMVIGERIFTVRINSQSKNETSLDWRHQPMEEMYEVGELSTETQHNLLKFHKKAGIIYAAYDFIVDDDGREIFLECNPVGQWLWLKNKLELSVCDAMADELLMGF